MKKLLTVSVAVFSVISLLCSRYYAEELVRDGVSDTEVHTHTWSEGIIKSYPTCEKDGKIAFFCTDCGAERTEIIVSNPAYHVYENDCDHTCNVCGAEREVPHVKCDNIYSDDKLHYYICSVCGEKIQTEEHKFGEEDENGICRCDVCGYSISNAEKHVHVLKKIDAASPTCTEPGNTKYYFCAECSKYFSDSKGKKEITDHESVIISPKGHTPKEVLPTVPTCLCEGESEKIICNDCGTVLLSPQIIPKISHCFDYEYLPDGHLLKCENCGFVANTVPHTFNISLLNDDALDFKCDCGHSFAVKLSELETDNGVLIINVPTVENVKDNGSAEIGVSVLYKLNSMITDQKSGFNKVRIEFGETYFVLDKYSLSSVVYADKKSEFKFSYSLNVTDSNLLNNSQLSTVSELPENSKILSVSFNINESGSNSENIASSAVSFPFELPRGWKADDVCVYRIDTSGEMIKNDCEYDGKTLVFSSDRNGFFAVTKRLTLSDVTDSKKSSVKPIILAVDVAIAIIVITVIIVAICKKVSEMNPYKDYDE